MLLHDSSHILYISQSFLSGHRNLQCHFCARFSPRAFRDLVMDLRVKCSLNHRRSIPRLHFKSVSITTTSALYSPYIRYRDVTNTTGTAIFQKYLSKLAFEGLLMTRGWSAVCRPKLKLTRPNSAQRRRNEQNSCQNTPVYRSETFR